MNNNYYKSFPLFNDVDNVELRTWNRCATIFNIRTVHDTKVAAGYMAQIVPEERSLIGKMLERVKLNGYESTRAEVNRNAIG